MLPGSWSVGLRVPASLPSSSVSSNPTPANNYSSDKSRTPVLWVASPRAPSPASRVNPPTPYSPPWAPQRCASSYRFLVASSSSSRTSCTDTAPPASAGSRRTSRASFVAASARRWSTGTCGTLAVCTWHVGFAATTREYATPRITMIWTRAYSTSAGPLYSSMGLSKAAWLPLG